jgi:pimeloyl-ACP methyl ester carboxylesterase
MRALACYWLADYDWRTVEAQLNALPQFTTEIDGVNIHFIHVKSQHENALPLVVTHGWPGSIIEMLEVVGPLTDPTAYGGKAEDAFDLVIPSIPGYGFSSEPTERGWESSRTAKTWPRIMERLGYTRFVAQGGDVGAAVSDAMGRQAPQGLVAVHTNLFVPALAGQPLPRHRGEAAQAHGRLQGDRVRLFPRDGDDRRRRLRPARPACRACGVVARPRHGQLLQIARAFASSRSLANSRGTTFSTTSRSTG